MLVLTLNSYLNNVKNKLTNNYRKWDFVKRYTNPYEFIHTLFQSTKYSVSKMKPFPIVL